MSGYKHYLKDKIPTSSQTIVSLEEIFSNYPFSEYRSFLVNISHMDSMSGGDLLPWETELLISKKDGRNYLIRLCIRFS